VNNIDYESRHDPVEWKRAKWELYRWQYGPSATNFTVQLYDLIAKADPGNRFRLHAGFPVNCECYFAWEQAADPFEFFSDLVTSPVNRESAK